MLAGLYGTTQLPSHTVAAPQYSSSVPLYSTAAVASPTVHPYSTSSIAVPTVHSYPAAPFAAAPLYLAGPSYDKNPADSTTLELVRILSSAHPSLGAKYPSPKDGVFITNLKTTVNHEKDKISYEYAAVYPTEKPEKNEATKFVISIAQPVIPAGFEPGDLKYDAKVDEKAKTYTATYTFSYKRVKL